MPPSIDPVETMFGTGASLFRRVLTVFAAGWAGNFLSRLCASFEGWDDLANPVEVIDRLVSRFDSFEALAFVLWPVILLYYLLKVPVYAIIVIPIGITALIRILFTDDPILFWALLVVAILSPGLVLTDGNAFSWLPLAFCLLGLGFGIWWAVRHEHGHWVEEIKSWFERDVD